MENKISSIIKKLESNGLYHESDRLFRVAQSLSTNKSFEDLLDSYEKNRIAIVQLNNETEEQFLKKYDILKKSLKKSNIRETLDINIAIARDKIKKLNQLKDSINSFSEKLYDLNSDQINDIIPKVMAEKFKVLKSITKLETFIKQLEGLKSKLPPGIIIPRRMGIPGENPNDPYDFSNIT